MTGVEWVVAALVGLLLGAVLGLLGGGGGILAIPLLVHVLGLPVDEATTMSLVVVAIGAAAGLIPHARAGRVDWRTGALFGWLGVVGATAGSRAAVVADDRLQLGMLVVLIFLAAYGMLRPARAPARSRAALPVPVGGGPAAGDGGDGSTGEDEGEDEDAGTRPSVLRTLLAATGVGFVTGFVGVGGGFIAVPALIWAMGMPVRKATATGLLVIVINSGVALIARGPSLIDWPLAADLALAAVVGAVAGALLSRRLRSATIRTAFGVLLVVVGLHEAWVLATS